jgi:hypothetical protein
MEITPVEWVSSLLVGVKLADAHTVFNSGCAMVNITKKPFAQREDNEGK